MKDQNRMRLARITARFGADLVQAAKEDAAVRRASFEAAFARSPLFE